MSLRTVALLALATLTFAGCASPGPSGTFTDLNHQPPVAGWIETVYQPFTGANPTGQVPTAGQMTQCAQGNIPAEAQPTTGTAVAQCKGPYTTFTAHANLPQPSADGYKLYAVGEGYEQEIFALQSEGGNHTGFANLTSDLESQVQELQIRMDGFTVAVVPGTAGNHTLELPAALDELIVSGTYTGHHLEVTVRGLPANGTYRGILYVADPASPLGYTPKENFEVKEGLTVYDSTEHDIEDFAQFHIHVGTSAVNLYKAEIGMKGV